MSTTTYPMLYGRASHGTIKVWSIAVEDHANESHIIITHGIENGKQQTTIRKVKAGKNIGRSNETTVAEQARLEAESFWNKKQDKGYAPNRHSLVDTGSARRKVMTRLPMLALKYQDRCNDLVFPVYVQPKLNGVRCLMERRGDEILFHSRGGKQFTTLDHIKADALKVMKDGDILDGELYCHQKISFQELVSLIKNDKNKEQNAKMLQEYVKFYNYDICIDAPFHERAKRLVSYVHIVKVTTWLAKTEDEIMACHETFMNQGYEGTMVRSGGHEPYRFQYRSPTLLKLKDFLDDDFEIIGAKEGVGKDEGKATFRCITKDKKEFEVRCKGTDEERREQWTNHKKYLGKKLTVKFQYLSDDGIPIFPVGIAIRDYE